MKKILTILTTFCFSFGIGYFAAMDLDKNLRYRKIIDEIKIKGNTNVRI